MRHYKTFARVLENKYDEVMVFRALNSYSIIET